MGYQQFFALLLRKGIGFFSEIQNCAVVMLWWQKLYFGHEQF